MIGAISDALISRASARISEPAPGRTPIAAARPPLVLPGFASPRSIILISTMAPSFPNFRNDSNSDYPKSSLTLILEYQKLNESFRGAHQRRSGIQISLCKGRFRVRVFDAFRDDEVACHAATGEARMQSTNWAPEHCEALRENL